MKKRIPVSELNDYYRMFGGDPDDLRYVTHAYRDERGGYYAYMPLAEDAFKEPWAPDGGEPWTRIGEYESNLIRRYSLVP